MSASIFTKYFGPTNTRGSRVKATASNGAGSMSVPWDYGLNVDQNHDAAAKALAKKLGWHGRVSRGGGPGGSGNVYVYHGTGNDIELDPERRKGPRRGGRIVEVVQTRYPRGQVRSRVHTVTRAGRAAVYEGPSKSPHMQGLWARARAQGVPIRRPLRARMVKDPKRCPIGMSVQSLVFPREHYTASTALHWAKSHGYRASKVHATGASYRVRVAPPSHFRASSFRVLPFGFGIRAIVGCPV